MPDTTTRNSGGIAAVPNDFTDDATEAVVLIGCAILLATLTSAACSSVS